MPRPKAKDWSGATLSGDLTEFYARRLCYFAGYDTELIGKYFWGTADELKNAYFGTQLLTEPACMDIRNCNLAEEDIKQVENARSMLDKVTLVIGDYRCRIGEPRPEEVRERINPILKSAQKLLKQLKAADALTREVLDIENGNITRELHSQIRNGKIDDELQPLIGDIILNLSIDEQLESLIYNSENALSTISGMDLAKKPTKENERKLVNELKSIFVDFLCYDPEYPEVELHKFVLYTLRAAKIRCHRKTIREYLFKSRY